MAATSSSALSNPGPEVTAGLSRQDFAVLSADPYLDPHEGHFVHRRKLFQQKIQDINEHEGGMDAFTQAYKRFGLHRNASNNGFEHREWAPLAQYVGLIGDFNGWDRAATPMTKDDFGVWSCKVPDGSDGPVIKHGDKIKLAVVTCNGEHVERIPAYCTYAVQDKTSPCFPNYESVYWNPPQTERYTWKNPTPPKPKSLRIYEAHVGMATEEGKIGSWLEFTRDVLPRVHRLGYTALQLMAVQEHPYYASFGYHVSSLFAPSSRFGPPEGLKELIDTAHGMGIVVIMDLVHAHAAINKADGLNAFDGSDHQYFHAGERGTHSLWESRLFNYGHWEVLRFLLSNCRFWMDEFRFDGFRFDGVTSILYQHHGIGVGFTGNYNEYFSGEAVDMDACVYLMLANYVIHHGRTSISVAEDVSGMPSLCRPIVEGGFGFDLRLAMSVPDEWIKMCKDVSDEKWDMGHIVHTLTNRRWGEDVVAYVESHDQALVGDKTIAFWLMDKEMYSGMSKLVPESLVVFRGLSLLKCIRALTYALGGQAYLNFMGNEFGHPEWVDFPRDGNNNSYHYARRQWSLADTDHLRYGQVEAFDAALHALDDTSSVLTAKDEFVTLKHENDKVIAFEKGGLVWVVNLHASKSYENYRIGVGWPGKFMVALDSDASEFGGHGRHDRRTEFFSTPEPWHDREHYIQVYTASRSVVAYRVVE